MSAGDPFHIVEIPARNLALTELNERCRVIGWTNKQSMDERVNRSVFSGWFVGTEHPLGAQYVIVHISRGGDQPAIPIWVEVDEPVCFIAPPPEPTTTPAHFGQ